MSCFIGRKEFGRIYFLMLVMLCGFLSSTLFFLGLSCLVEPSALNVQPNVNPKTLYFHRTAETKNSERYNDWKSDQLSPVHFRELSLLKHVAPDGAARRLHNKKGINEPGDYPDTDQDYFGGPPQQNQKLLSKEHSHRKGYRTIEKTILTKSGRGASKKLPQAIIIGVKKGGTRALLEFLRIHPDVRGPGPESHFFDRHYSRGIEWYRRQMPSTLEGQLTMEKTPSYFVTKVVPQRIYNMSRSVKLIMVVRDPVTRAISDYTQAVTKRPDIKSFEQMAFLDNHTGLVDTSWGAIRIGVYAKHLERWLKFFPLKQIHFVNGEKLISNPAGELAKVQDFLGLKRVITDKHFYFNITKGFPCLKKPEGSGNPHCLGKTKGRPHPIIEERVIKRLRDFFRPFNQKFYQLTGVNFEWP